MLANVCWGPTLIAQHQQTPWKQTLIVMEMTPQRTCCFSNNDLSPVSVSWCLDLSRCWEGPGRPAEWFDAVGQRWLHCSGAGRREEGECLTSKPLRGSLGQRTDLSEGWLCLQLCKTQLHSCVDCGAICVLFLFVSSFYLLSYQFFSCILLNHLVFTTDLFSRQSDKQNTDANNLKNVEYRSIAVSIVACYFWLLFLVTFNAIYGSGHFTPFQSNSVIWDVWM